jgi:hypothetical protein
LSFAVTLAAEVAEGQGPVDLDTALRFLPLVAAQQPDNYDAWALRWLSRWINEAPDATIDAAAEIACSLADGLIEPLALESVRSGLRGSAIPHACGCSRPRFQTGTWGALGRTVTLADIATFATGDPELGRRYAEERLAQRRATPVAA